VIPNEIRVFPLSKTKETEAFGTLDKAYNFFCDILPSQAPPGRFNIPSANSHFRKNSLVLFQYSEKRNEEKIIAHATLISNGCVLDEKEKGYVGYYLFDPDSINVYHNPVTKNEIHNIWKKNLCRAKLNLNTSDYDKYVTLLETKGNLLTFFPEEVAELNTYFEGAVKRVYINAYERNPKARAKCLEHHDYVCQACGTVLSDVYGDIAKECIHVHHLIPLSNLDRDYKVDPVKDLLPVCPNCHAMIHRRNPPYSVGEIAELIRSLKNRLRAGPG
jgi:predicted HNH restriction endonuclease